MKLYGQTNEFSDFYIMLLYITLYYNDPQRNVNIHIIHTY